MTNDNPLLAAFLMEARSMQSKRIADAMDGMADREELRYMPGAEELEGNEEHRVISEAFRKLAAYLRQNPTL